MRRLLPLLAALALAACGADGEPEPRDVPPGVGITGTVEFGVSGTL